MRTGHDVARLGIAPRNLRDDVFGLQVALIITRRDGDRDRRCIAGLRQPHQLAVVLLRQFDGGQRQRLAGLEIIALTMDQLAIAVAHLDDCERTLGLEKRGELAEKAAVLDLQGRRIRIEHRLRVGIEFRDLGIGVALEHRPLALAGLAWQRNEHDLARQLPLPLREVLLARHRRDHDRRLHRAAGGRRPRDRNRRQRQRPRRHHRDRIAVEVPAHTEVERLDMHVGKAALPEQVHRPAFRLAMVLRIGEARADAVHQRGGGGHRLAAVHAFIDDAGNRGALAIGGGRKGNQHGGGKQRRREERDKPARSRNRHQARLRNGVQTANPQSCTPFRPCQAAVFTERSPASP